MPSFLSDLRRKSRNSFKTEQSADSASSGNTSIDEHADGVPQNKSSSTLSSFFGKTSDPGSVATTATTTRSKSSTNLNSRDGTPNGARTPPASSPRRPPIKGAGSSGRYSMLGSPTNGSPKSGPFTSALSPRVSSVSDGSWVHQKVLLISGILGEGQQSLDGNLVVCHHQDSFPPTNWPVCESHFKALVHLLPGPNRLRLDFISSRRPSQGGNAIPHSTWININYLPLVSAPPLHLAILVAKDSPMTFDAMPERVKTEGNGIETAIRKFRMSAYLWQAFTGEQMTRNGFGRRCFRYEEEWQLGSLTNRDLETGQFRNEAKIHVIRMNKTTEEIRALDLAQQYEPAKAKGDLFGIALDTVKAHFGHKSGQKQYVSCMFLDTHWDKQVGTVRGHAALGGGADGLQLAIFGSHLLQSYPAHIEEVVPAFSDCTKTDTDYVANDCNESGSSWEAANIGIGAHLHETGHLFGCPHQESGVMLRDYVRLNRTFTCREPYSTRTKSSGQTLHETAFECAWHRLDILRFRFHPCFQLPSDQSNAAEESIQVWAVDNGSALITATTGIAWIEIYPEGDDVCHHWIEYLDQASGPLLTPRQITLTDADLRARVGDSVAKNKRLALKIFSVGGGEHSVADFSALVHKSGKIKLPDGRAGFRGSKVGASAMDGSQPLPDVLLQSFYIATKLMTSVRVYSGLALDGIEFVYEDGETQLFGKRGGKAGGDEFLLDTRRHEMVLGFHLRAGLWIDGVQILTSNGRRSEIYGNKTGGSGHTLIPPRGYALAGLYGSCGNWLDGFGLIISR